MIYLHSEVCALAIVGIKSIPFESHLDSYNKLYTSATVV